MVLMCVRPIHTIHRNTTVPVCYYCVYYAFYFSYTNPGSGDKSNCAARARAHTHSYTKNIASDLLVVGFGFVCFFRFMVAGIEIFDSSSTCNCLVLRNK